MSTRSTFPAALLTALLLAGCAAPAPTAPASQAVTVTGPLALRTAGGYQLLEEAGMRAWKATDIAYLKVFLKRGDGMEVALGEHPDRSAPLVLQNLRMDTAYTVRLEAYMADDTRIDAADAACETTFTTENDPTVELAGQDAFKVKLADRTFAGEAEGSVAITDGGLDDTADAESLKQAESAGEPLFTWIPLGGRGRVSADGGGQRLSLAAGTSQTYRTPDDIAWFIEPTPSRQAMETKVFVRSWPVGGHVIVGCTTPEAADATGLDDAIRYRLRKTGAGTIAVDVWHGGAFIPFSTPTVEVADPVMLFTGFGTELTGDGPIVKFTNVFGAFGPGAAFASVDILTSPMFQTRRAAVIYRFENPSASDMDFVIEPPSVYEADPE